MTPDQYTLNETFIKVGGGHTLYAQTWGNKNGLPVIFLHGGPGGNTSDKNKMQFNPDKHFVIFFDQRGGGKSLPYGSLENNKTSDLVSDINKIAEHFKVKNFVLCGGSWGACLALAYGIANPGKVRAMILAGIFTGSQLEIDYFDKGEYSIYFPDAWEKLLNNTPKQYHKNPVKFHYKKMLGNDSIAAKKSAYVYENFERALLKLDDRLMPEPYEEFDPTSITTEAYYLKNRCFMPDNFIFDNAHKLKMPIWLLQGRYDMVCPPRTAYNLSKILPNGKLYWTLSGHVNEHETWNMIKSILETIGNV